jgi:hypothetical protein
MKKMLINSFVIILVFGLSACDNAVQPQNDVAVEVDNNPENQDFQSLEEDLTFEKLVIGKRLEGYSQRGDYKFPYYFVFSKNGNVKMYEKPFEIEDWELVQDFNVVKGRVNTEDENVDDIIDWSDVLKLNTIGKLEDLSDENSEGIEDIVPVDDGIKVTLYAEGTQVGAESPFNMVLTIDPSGQNMFIDFLKHKIVIDKISDL